MKAWQHVHLDELPDLPGPHTLRWRPVRMMLEPACLESIEPQPKAAEWARGDEELAAIVSRLAPPEERS